jgi:hypothetical protein
MVTTVIGLQLIQIERMIQIWYQVVMKQVLVKEKMAAVVKQLI